MRIEELIGLGGIEEASGNFERAVKGLAYDSRRVAEGFVFFALPGARADGHQFVPEALERGACAVVLQRKLKLPADATWILARDVRRTMGLWAAEFFGHPSRKMAVVGVTGTNGKTTVTYLLESIFRTAGLAPGVIGTINYRYRNRSLSAHHTTPEAIELESLLAAMAAEGVDAVAMEVSSHALALERVRGLAFDGGVFTNLSRDHLDFHRDMDDYFRAKSLLFSDHLRASSKRRKFAVISAGDRYGQALLGIAREAGLESYSYGFDARCDIHPRSYEADREGVRGVLRVAGEEIPFRSALLTTANLENIMAAAGAARAMGLAREAIARGIEALGPVPGRLEPVPNRLRLTVLVDYAHTPAALERVLEELRPLTGGKLIVVFGCGGDRDRGKRPVMGEIAGRLADYVVLTSDNPRSEEPLGILREVEAGVQNAGLPAAIAAAREDLPARAYWMEPDRARAIALALRLASPADLVLVAGKGHEDYQIIGSRRLRFDDREVARLELERLAS